MSSEATLPAGAKWRAIGLLAACQVFVLGLWFSASAIIPALRAQGLSDERAAWLTGAVSIGFVAGTLLSAILGLADRIPAKKLFAASAMLGAVANAAILVVGPTSDAALLLRFITGAAMAGVYPVGMKMVSTWAKGDTGLLVGILVGALTLGSAAPHLFNAAGGVDWRLTLILASVSAAIGAALISTVQLGPTRGKRPPFQPSLALQAWTQKGVRLANLGYFGHMWELYAMWGWCGLLFHESFTKAASPNAALFANLATFSVVAAGAVGSLAGGFIADRFGRTTLTIGAMSISGTCALTAGLLFEQPWLLLVLCLVWGVSIVADSAQFSSCVIELSNPDHVGTMLTIQTSVGFLLTLASINLLPVFLGELGWRWAFAPLAVGPYLGVIAMWTLRRHPDAVRLAGGRR